MAKYSTDQMTLLIWFYLIDIRQQQQEQVVNVWPSMKNGTRTLEK